MLGKFITHCEDSLTAAVLTHLLHLPIEVFWRIFRNACYTESLPEYPGEALVVEFQPKWKAAGTLNVNYVEPDVFIRFASFDLIIEAKRNNECMQSPDQWRTEVIAYANEYGDENLPVRMLALGGVWSNHDRAATSERIAVGNGTDDSPSRPVISCPVHMCRWDRLLAECQRMKKELQRLKYPSSQTHADRRILADLIDLFAWHSFQTGKWFADTVPDLPQLGQSMQSHHRAFQNLSSRLTRL